MRGRGNYSRKECRSPAVDSALRVDIELFSRGGLAVLDSIEAIGYNTLQHRPSISKSKQFSLLARALSCACFSFTAFGARCSRRTPGRLAIVEGGKL